MDQSPRRLPARARPPDDPAENLRDDAGDPVGGVGRNRDPLPEGGTPADPDVAGVACFLKPDFIKGQEAGERGGAGNSLTWTHVMLIDTSVDIRDGYIGVSNVMVQDTVYIPNKNGTKFFVTFIERMHRGLPAEHKKVYLDRQLPNWPTNNL